MPNKIDDLLPTAKEIQRQTALEAAEKAEQYARLQAAAEVRKTPTDRATEQAVGADRG